MDKKKETISYLAKENSLLVKSVKLFWGDFVAQKQLFFLITNAT